MSHFVFVSNSYGDKFTHDYDSAIRIVEKEYRSPRKLVSKLKNKFIESIVLDAGKLVLLDTQPKSNKDLT